MRELACSPVLPSLPMLQDGFEKQERPLNVQGGPCGQAGGRSAAPDRTGRVSVQPELPVALGEAVVGNWAGQGQDPASQEFGAGGTSCSMSNSN